MPAPIAVMKSMPVLKRIWLPLLNLIGKKNDFRIIVTSPDYMEVEILWGAFRFEKGEKREFVVRGTDNYINAIISSLEMKNLNAKTVLSK